MLLPLDITRCEPVALEALYEVERGATAFAAGREAGFRGVVHPDARAAQAAGQRAFQQQAEGRAAGAQGMSSTDLKAVLAAAQAAADEASTGMEVEISGASRVWVRDAWACRTCACSTGTADPACCCDCPECRQARESLCDCAQARAAGGPDTCSCPPGCPCSCQGCHRRQGAGASGAGASEDGASEDAAGQAPTTVRGFVDAFYAADRAGSRAKSARSKWPHLPAHRRAGGGGDAGG